MAGNGDIEHLTALLYLRLGYGQCCVTDIAVLRQFLLDGVIYLSAAFFRHERLARLGVCQTCGAMTASSSDHQTMGVCWSCGCSWTDAIPTLGPG
ncbi:hypothetical protein D8B24_20340 [Verminephrobacter aporrectodeae subsp. tuberculatae]|nr:hypothetical protein [Verminephrobacter aporrectodeae subsp. tuberculatae]